MLTQMLVVEDSDHYCLFSEKDREQLLFKIFSNVCVGGGMSQFEDDVAPYLNATKSIYKELVSVRRNKSTQSVEVCSDVYRISASEPSLFPNASDHNLCVASIDASKRQVTVFYSGWLSFW